MAKRKKYVPKTQGKVLKASGAQRCVFAKLEMQQNGTKKSAVRQQ